LIGEYPTCGTGSTEASDEISFVRRRRGLLVAAATDFSIDLGFVMAGVVALIVLAAYHQHVSDGVWRINFGIGFILPVALLFLRLRQFDSTQYKKHAIKQDIPYLLVIKRYWKPMLGTSLAWFFYDFVVSTVLQIHKLSLGLYIDVCHRHILSESSVRQSLLR